MLSVSCTPAVGLIIPTTRTLFVPAACRPLPIIGHADHLASLRHLASRDYFMLKFGISVHEHQAIPFYTAVIIYYNIT
ncbi:hypothetical protein C8F04DRAFT_1400876, partial [Mycena alexandri]